jgi:hypothetical protein
MLLLIAIGVIIGWYVPRPSIVDTIVNKAKDIINNIKAKFIK